MKLIRKLIIGISTLSLLVLTFVSATYAWFEINSKASVENFHFEVYGGQGFLVSIDNVNYYNSLSKEQLQKSMLVSYKPNYFELATDGSEILYYKDAEGNKYDHSDRVDEHVGNFIQLLPLTTIDGREFKELFSTTSTADLGRFIEFNVYFKTVSELKSDNFVYDIYLNDVPSKSDNNVVIEPTTITAPATEIVLSADMNATVYDDTLGTKVQKNYRRQNNDKVTVYSSNAIRLSVTENEYYEEYKKNQQGEDELDEDGKKIVERSGYKIAEYDDSNERPTKIFEINDTVNGKYNLGSYATNYSTLYPTDTTSEEYMLYNCEYNAMYTYYNNLKPTQKLDTKLLDYGTVTGMNVIRDLSSHERIATIESGGKPKKLTFRIWLEGWDADCFDGLCDSIQMRLTFGSILKSQI